MFAWTSGTKQEKLKDAKAPPAGKKIKTKDTMTSIRWVPIQPEEEETEEEKAEVATHLRGGDPLIGHFTTTNLNSEDEDWSIE